MRRLVLVAMLVAAGAAVYAQAPDGEIPANEGVCDDLMYATPGLYGLCIAFCEAQDCEPDLSLEDPFANCRPSSRKLLNNYNRKKQASDPEMPCFTEPCPCWAATAGELEALPYPGGDWIAYDCSKDRSTTWYSNRDYFHLLSPTLQSGVIVSTIEYYSPWDGPYCSFNSWEPGGGNTTRLHELTTEEFAICEAQLNQAAIDRGISCWQD